MQVMINKQFLCLVLFIFVVVVFVLQHSFQLFWDEKLVFIAPEVTGNRGKGLENLLIAFEIHLNL